MYEESTQDQYFEQDSIHIYAYIHSKKVGCLVLRHSHHDGYYIHTLLGSYATLLIKKIHITFILFVCLFCCFTPQVNSYGHGRTVSSPNHTFFPGQAGTRDNQYFVHILSLVSDNNPS